MCSIFYHACWFLTLSLRNENVSVSQNSINNKVKNSLQASECMLKSSWTMDQVFSQWSFTSQLLTGFTCLWKQEHLRFPSITAGSEVLLLCPYFLYTYFQQQSWQLVQIFFDSIVHFCFVLVLCLIFSPVCLPWHRGACQFELCLLLFLVPSCFRLPSTAFGKLESAFGKHRLHK